jgi:hypothetical protein
MRCVVQGLTGRSPGSEQVELLPGLPVTRWTDAVGTAVATSRFVLFWIF